MTRAPGRVVPFARVQIVQSEEGGAISRINVREGDLVQAGDLLVELDTVQLVAGVSEARACRRARKPDGAHRCRAVRQGVELPCLPQRLSRIHRQSAPAIQSPPGRAAPVLAGTLRPRALAQANSCGVKEAAPRRSTSAGGMVASACASHSTARCESVCKGVT
ncbi:biotin/lipoyl-binding protein [Aurantiacibacter aquimixticola]|uniref:Biotin/lipoyl-binding protein n=1 Tax=Aurantiacibacter aquimixticola TaxID=1958945 RepID=A0A419RWD2_9SPHN|nr:biotin/lipoyl-binding protein [Aurantiacibacter aquimixticola]